MWIKKLFISTVLLCSGWVSETDLPSLTVNGDLQKVFGNNATLKAIGGVYTSGLQDNTSLTTNKGQVEALEIAKQMLKSNVWEITLGDNPTWTPGNQLQDTQGRPIPSYTWMIGSDLPNQDYDNYKILNANSLSLAVQKAGVMMAGGAGEDVLTGGLGADTLIGGLDSDTLIGGDGSDTFVFAKDSGDIGGITGDVIKDFNFGKNGGVQADTISLYQLFDSRLVSQLGKGAVNDASTLSSYVKLEWTKLDNNLQMVCSVDQTGNSNFSKLFTMTDLIHSVGDGNFNQNQVDQTRLYGGETTSALLQKMLEEGRLVVQ